MIRHRVGNEFLLFHQKDHAVFAGMLAGHVGNDLFQVPAPFMPTVQGIAMHDSGWPLHDELPTIDAEGLPTHVLHTPLDVSTQVWKESAARAAAMHPWSGLLVSLHVLRLSTYVQPTDPTQKFEVNKFQHAQIELQEKLRTDLGLRVDLPLRLGLAVPGVNEDEDMLLFDAGLMRMADSLALDVCCETALFHTIDQVFPNPGGEPITLHIDHPARFALTVDPWPFDVGQIVWEVPARRVSASPFTSLEAFREAFEYAAYEQVGLRVVARS